MSKFVILSMIIALTFPHMSVAEPSLIKGGIICDTLDEAIANIEKRPAPTCGRLLVLAPAEITPVVEYDYKGFRFFLVEYNFTGPIAWDNPIQYGFWGVPQKITKKVPDQSL